MFEELKPCPFCGSAAAKLTHKKEYLTMYSYVRCVACGASTKEIANSEEYFADTKAIAAWNRRDGE